MSQATCDSCRAPLQAGAAYCDECGRRTNVAVRRVRLAVRLEVVFVALVTAMVVVFTVVQYVQR